MALRSLAATIGTVSLVLAASVAGLAAEPKVLSLWPDGAPGARGTAEKDHPKLYVYLVAASQATGSAVVVFPGGGYGGLAMSYEGHDIARWLNGFGVAGLVVDYRHRGKGYGHPAPLQDAQRAIRTARARAAEWQLDENRIGVLGFSAGGHLASTAATHFDAGEAQAKDPIMRQGCRPDFAILCYPVIALDRSYSHAGTRKNLLGEHPDPRLVANLSNQHQVTAATPPCFLWTTDEDKAVPAENSVAFFQALRKANVPAELHVFAHGRHGLGLASGTPGTKQWPTLCRAWLDGLGMLERRRTPRR